MSGVRDYFFSPSQYLLLNLFEWQRKETSGVRWHSLKKTARSKERGRVMGGVFVWESSSKPSGGGDESHACAQLHTIWRGRDERCTRKQGQIRKQDGEWIWDGSDGQGWEVGGRVSMRRVETRGTAKWKPAALLHDYTENIICIGERNPNMLGGWVWLLTRKTSHRWRGILVVYQCCPGNLHLLMTT